MIMEFKLNPRDMRLPLRFTLGDVIRFFGEELKQEGFNLEKEIVYSVRYDICEIGHSLKVYQDDRFRVVPANSFYPFAII